MRLGRRDEIEPAAQLAPLGTINSKKIFYAC